MDAVEYLIALNLLITEDYIEGASHRWLQLKSPQRAVRQVEMLSYLVMPVCPRCGPAGHLSDIRTNGPEPVRHCFSCNFDFPIDEFGNAVRREV